MANINPVEHNANIQIRLQSKLKQKFTKKCAKLGCSQAFLIRRLIEEWVNGDLIKEAACDTFVLNK